MAAGYVLHVGSLSRGNLKRGKLKAGDIVSAEVDYVRRQRIVPNHTFTHVLNFALREVCFVVLECLSARQRPPHGEASCDMTRAARPQCSLAIASLRMLCGRTPMRCRAHSKACHAQVLGDHVDQKGSIVQPDRLRFDFSHSGPIDGPTLGRIENICNEQLTRKLRIYAKDCALSEARQINGGVPS